MPAAGALSVGRGLTSATTGSVVNICPRSCQLLGFYANATTTLIIYDDSATGTGNKVGPSLSACAVGWNPLPLDLVNGLAINQGAQLLFVVV
jgi:hypothetical protein